MGDKGKAVNDGNDTIKDSSVGLAVAKNDSATFGIACSLRDHVHGPKCGHIAIQVTTPHNITLQLSIATPVTMRLLS
jgi:hypothetical protein